MAELVLAVLLMSFTLICNIYVLIDVAKHGKGRLFFEKWRKEVESTQKYKWGRFCMKTFYILPTVVAVGSYVLGKES